MISKLFIAALTLESASAEFGIGFCRTSNMPPQLKFFDAEKFSGKWYEIYRDYDHDFWSD
jgi:hypothetical protein